MTIDLSRWLLIPSAAGDGKPWGNGTRMAARAKSAGTAVPGDAGCKVTTLIGGYSAMSDIRDSLESLILDAGSSASPPGKRGHVYIAHWRFNSQRDLSSLNPWGTHAWNPAAGDLANYKDQTALGLVLRLMQAGVIVRILVWLPNPIANLVAGLQAHVADHVYLARVVAAENKRLKAKFSTNVALGIVGLDSRTTDGAVAGAHHQKMMVIRSPELNIAYCGGVDLAFTRRDAPANPANYQADCILDGDWQSSDMPGLSGTFPRGINWPPDGDTSYVSASKIKPPSDKQGSDLPTRTNTKEICDALGGTWDEQTKTCTIKTAVGTQSIAKDIYSVENQLWHDQHLRLEGPIVASIEWQFCERWIDFAKPDSLADVDEEGVKTYLSNWGVGKIYFSSADALSGDSTSQEVINPLSDPVDIPAIAGESSFVQLWRTIPMRDSRKGVLFRDGEFTVMAGYAKAMAAATELIWIFDQYFWSEPVARLLNLRIRTVETLCIVIVLPPFADTTYPEIHRARQLALLELTLGLNSSQRARIVVYNMWRAKNGVAAQGKGVYVHAKAQTYDGALLVCGSANLNRRSLTCDTELACAVADPVVVFQHQQRLWTLLFGGVAGEAGSWSGLDLNLVGKGKRFLEKFVTAAELAGANLVKDPWDDDNPIQRAPKPVALPNGTPRPAAFPGPKYELYYGAALDAGSLDPMVENDIVDATMVPRGARVDDVVYNIEGIYIPRVGAPPSYPYRKQASLVRGQLIHLAGTLYYDRGYHYTETAVWFKQVCAGLPCFRALGWPDYRTLVVENVQIDGHDVVLQLWKGWCQRFLGMDGMPGGVGAEVGVYRRIPGQLQKFLGQIGNIDVFQGLKKHVHGELVKYAIQVLQELAARADDPVWWPFPELNAKVDFKLINPNTGNVLFRSKPEHTYWNCKWMTPDDYDNKYKSNSANQAPLVSCDYILEYTVKGKRDELSGVWSQGGFPF